MSFIHDNELVVAGGVSGKDSPPLKEVWTIDLKKTDRWMQSFNNHDCLHVVDGRAVVFENKIWVSGGFRQDIENTLHM